MFPAPGASIYYNEAGEVLGWDNDQYYEPDYDPYDYYEPDYDDEPEEDEPEEDDVATSDNEEVK